MQGATAISGEENTWRGNLASSRVSYRYRARRKRARKVLEEQWGRESP